VVGLNFFYRAASLARLSCQTPILYGVASNYMSRPLNFVFLSPNSGQLNLVLSTLYGREFLLSIYSVCQSMFIVILADSVIPPNILNVSRSIRGNIGLSTNLAFIQMAIAHLLVAIEII